MKITVDHIHEKPILLHGDEPVDSFPVLVRMQVDGECAFTGTVRYDMTAAREYDHLRVAGRISTPLTLVCSRCLAVFESFVDTGFTILYRKGSSLESSMEEETELNDQDLISATYSGDEIDLTHEIEEQIAMEVPLKALCGENCKGLCPTCGADLNQTTCTCSDNPISFKFSALKDFKVSN